MTPAHVVWALLLVAREAAWLGADVTRRAALWTLLGPLAPLTWTCVGVVFGFVAAIAAWRAGIGGPCLGAALVLVFASVMWTGARWTQRQEAAWRASTR